MDLSVKSCILSYKDTINTKYALQNEVECDNEGEKCKYISAENVG